MEEFLKMQWPVSVFLSILSVCFISVIIIGKYFKPLLSTKDHK